MSMTRGQKRLTPTSPLKQVTSTRRFSFFGLKRDDDCRRPDLPEPAEDELLNLDITASLFPAGWDGLNEKDALEVLKSIADDLIRRLQAAYKQRTFALHEALAEKNEKQEEFEETRTRIGHLRTQLDEMAEKVLQQERAMKAMAEELEQTRLARQQSEESLHKCDGAAAFTSTDKVGAQMSETGRDLPPPLRDSLKRSSGGTFASDSGFESGDESLAESVWSQRECLDSPVYTGAALSPNVLQAASFPPASWKTSRKDPSPARSAYDKVLRGLASTSLTGSLMGSSSRCTICHGVPASEAWSVLSVLKEENNGLKCRLGELESTIEECLSIMRP